MEHRDVRLPVNFLQPCRAQSEPCLASPGLVATPEEVRQLRPELLATAESSKVPTVVAGLQQAQLGVVGGHLGPGSQHPGLDQLGSLLLWRLLVDRPGEEVTIRLPSKHALVVLLRRVVEELQQHGYNKKNINRKDGDLLPTNDMVRHPMTTDMDLNPDVVTC